MPTLSYPGTPGTTLYAGLPTLGGALITTLSLVNTSGSTQAANFVSPMFGQSFVEGDLPTGEYPVFTLDDDTPCPATVYNDASWPDGSKRMCGVFFRSPTSIAASSSLNINVKSGGAAPAASSRTLADLTAADIAVELTGVTNLSGVWVASLNEAITDATDIVEIGDGPAGKMWRISGPFKQSGSAHGQLHCWHYLLAAENEVGGLAHIRHTAYFGQMFTDVASPAPARIDATGRLLSGATEVRVFSGYTTGPGSITGTFALTHYTLASSAGADGKWDFFQSGGSQSAEATVRALPYNVNAVQSYVVPPVDLSRTVPDSANVDYVINGKGDHETWAMPGTGERREIGLIPEWAAHYWINQSAANEKAVRVSALSATGWLCTGLRSDTNRPPAVVGTSFTGLTVQPTITLRAGTIINVSVPSPNAQIWNVDSAHRPAPTYSAYVMSGEPQYLDLMIWHAMGHVMNREPGYKIVNNTRPIATTVAAYAGSRGARINDVGTPYEAGGVLYTTGGIRQGAWSMRDIGQAYAMCPDASPDGADYKGYLLYVLESAADFLIDYVAGSPTDYQNSGLLIQNNKSTTSTENGFMDNYMTLALCHISALSGNAKLTAIRQYYGKRFPAVDAVANLGVLTAFQYFGWSPTGIAESWAEIVHRIGSVTTLTFSVASNNVTLAVNSGFADWNFTNGDIFMFLTTDIPAVSYPYAEMGDYVYLYAVNSSGKTCQFSLTPGGSPLTVVQDRTHTGGYWARVQTAAVGWATGTVFDNGPYVSIAAGANYHELLGDPVGTQAAKLRSGRDFNVDYVNIVDKYAFTNTLPA